MAGKSLPNGQQQLPAGAVAGAAVVAAAAGRRAVCEPGVARLGVVLGTGLGGLADRLDDARSIPARETGWLVSSTATGHAGRVVWGWLGGQGSQGGEPSRCEVVVLQGRVHGYEGHAPESLSRGVELLAALGATTVLLTNAAGGLRPDMQVGELMVLSDHIDLVRRPWAEGLRTDPIESVAADGAARAATAAPCYDPEIVAGALEAALLASLNATYTDVDAVANKLSFDSAALNSNTDPRVRKNGQASANDLMMAYVLYKVYGSSASSTADMVFNLQDAHDMLMSSDYAAALIASFNAAESHADASGNEKGAIDAMFRDLLAADSLRFFDASGTQVPGLFEVNADVSGAGNWNLVAGDVIEIRTVFTFVNSVTLRASTDVAQNLNPLPTQADGETVYIAPGSKLYIRLQLVASA